MQLTILNEKKHEPNKRYLVNCKRNDGFGAQFQTIIFYILYAEFNGLEFVYNKIDEIQHNYDNNPLFLENVNNFINIKGNTLDISNINTDYIVDVPLTHIYRTVESNIDLYTNNNPSFNKIKECFWKNKDRNVFKNNKINIAVHIRRPNIHMDEVEERYTCDSYFLTIISYIRTKYKNSELLFHIYSQGELSNFECYKNTDTELHIDDDLISTFLGLVGAEILVMSRSSFSYSAALLSDGEVYYLPFWHTPRQNWIGVNYK